MTSNSHQTGTPHRYFDGLVAQKITQDTSKTIQDGARFSQGVPPQDAYETGSQKRPSTAGKCRPTGPKMGPKICPLAAWWVICSMMFRIIC